MTRPSARPVLRSGTTAGGGAGSMYGLLKNSERDRRRVSMLIVFAGFRQKSGVSVALASEFPTILANENATVLARVLSPRQDARVLDSAGLRATGQPGSVLMGGGLGRRAKEGMCRAAGPGDRVHPVTA